MTVGHSLRLLGCCLARLPPLLASSISKLLHHCRSDDGKHLLSRRPFEVFALALDLGNITSTSEPIVWSLGVVRNPVVAYTTGTGQSQTRVPYFLAQYNSIPDAVSVP